jgi:hypothetical protein
VHEQSPTFQAGALIELSGNVDTAFEIYYETYDIHELLASSLKRRSLLRWPDDLAMLCSKKA